MRKWIIGLVLFIGTIEGVLSQNAEIKGCIRDERNKERMEFANVVLQTADSVFVSGTTSDAKGNFTFNRVKKGDYLIAVSSLGYRTQYIVLNGFSTNVALGDIFMDEDAVSLEDVTVAASSQTSRSDRKIVFPTERQVQAATNGTNLLQQLMLPKIQVNPMTNSISVPGGGEVQLRINGAKVEESEIKALLPADIIRIEYHDNPGLRYGNAEVVLDYIVRRPETGGNLSADMTQGINAMWGNYSLAGKINHKKAEWATSYWFGPRSFTGLSRDNEEVFHFADGQEIRRIEAGEPARGQTFMHNLHFTFSYQEPEKYLFNATLRYRGNIQPHWNYQGTLYNAVVPSDQVSMIDWNDSRDHRPALDLYYQRDMKHDQVLVVNVVGTYNDSKSHRIYRESRDEQFCTDIENRVDGNKYSVIGEAIYEKKFANANRISAGLRHNQAFSDNNYRNGHAYTTKMTQAETYLYAEFNGKYRKLDYRFGAGVSRYWFHQKGEGDAYQYYTFRPRLTLQYNLPEQSFIRLNASINNATPSLSNLSAVEQIIDSIQIERGNPNLKPYMNYGVALTYEIQKGIFYGNLWGSYEYQPDAIMDEKRLEGNKIVQTWDNQRNWQRAAGRMMLRVGPIRDILQISFTGGVNHYISNGNTYSHRYTNWFCESQASLTYKKFSLMYQLMTNWNWFSGETLSGGENIQMMMANYRHKNLSVGAGIINPFTDNYKVQTENWNRHASYRRSMYIKESARLFFVTVSYNFSFGRTFQAVQKKIHNSDEESGVMNAGK